MNRRQSLIHGFATLCALATSQRGNAAPGGGRRGGTGRLLFLGGTGFIGPHMVERALAEGWTVTLFTRGRAGRELFPGVERLTGDRSTDLSALRGRSWDVVIDNSGYVPAHVRASATLLQGSVGHYIFTSTIDAYRDFKAPGITEDYPLAALPEGAPHDAGRFYGALKALCEREVQAVFAGRSTIIRPGWVVGPGDNGNYFTYWVMRFRRGGDILAPGTPNDPVQMVDVRDLAAFVIAAAQSRLQGPFTCVGPARPWGELHDVLRAASGAESRPVWVPAEFLLSERLRPYFDLPLWCPPRNDLVELRIPSGLQGGEGAFQISGEKAARHGMNYRPWGDSTRDVLAWHEREIGAWPDSARVGLSREREAALLQAWAAQR